LPIEETKAALHSIGFRAAIASARKELGIFPPSADRKPAPAPKKAQPQAPSFDADEELPF